MAAELMTATTVEVTAELVAPVEEDDAAGTDVGAGLGGGYLGGVLVRPTNDSGTSTAISRCGPASHSDMLTMTLSEPSLLCVVLPPRLR